MQITYDETMWHPKGDYFKSNRYHFWLHVSTDSCTPLKWVVSSTKGVFYIHFSVSVLINLSVRTSSCSVAFIFETNKERLADYLDDDILS